VEDRGHQAAARRVVVYQQHPRHGALTMEFLP
jgi:hypothetical protein